MSSSVTVRGNSGIGLTGVLFVVFLVLKLCGVIGWSWWWVTAPLWAPAVFLLGIALVCLIIAVLTAPFRQRRHRERFLGW